MALPRSKYVLEGQEGVYHCFTRCVRRAFLCGFDTLTDRDFSHRKTLLLDRLRHLAAVFAIEVCAFAILENHYHLILRTRPDLVALWSDHEVATRWLTLFPRHRDLTGAPIPPAGEEIRALADCPDRIATLRRRLCSLSWFMGRLNEFVARVANQEDHVKGRFWESRFKCQALLDDAAITAGMVYVDLNPVRAGLAATPEESDFTSIQQRIRAWKNQTTATASLPGETAQELPTGSVDSGLQIPDTSCEIPGPVPESISAPTDSLACAPPFSSWLCPIHSDSQRRGILQMTAAEYFDLVDRSGRMMRSGNRGSIDSELAPILLRIGAKPDAWGDTVSRFGAKFRLAAGKLSSLRNFADQLRRRWFAGVATARAAFAT